MFNSNTLFLEKDGEEELEERKKIHVTTPHLSRVMQHGTAKLMCDTTKEQQEEEQEEDEELLCVSIVAQAEREDFQEFTPSHTHRHVPPPQHHAHTISSVGGDVSVLSDSEEDELRVRPSLVRRIRRRKSVRRPPQEVEQRPVIRGLWVQELDRRRSEDAVTSWLDIIPPPPQFSDSVDLRWESDCSSISSATFDLVHVSGFTSSQVEWDSDSTESMEQSMLGESDSVDEAVPDELRGKVTHVPKIFVCPRFRDVMRRTVSGWRTSTASNEGLVFHHKLQPRGCEYREGEHYHVLRHIQNGSYGDVFTVQDSNTGFKCAAKKIPLTGFSSEEVNTWSALDSPRIVELFGVVRDGVNVVLFMDLKPACLGQLLKEMGRLPEDLALHYLHQTLGALEHLHDRKVLHLDVKADNVLLSADCMDTFLCDFGLSQTLQESGRSHKTVRRPAFPGTETHMSPEVAAGDALSVKADVWSSCCMLLHMLNGCPPWTRCYSHPLCLQIVNEPPPLWEVPSTCNHFTVHVLRAGLKKEPQRRASAKELKRKCVKACRAVGGLGPQSLQSARENLQHICSHSEGNIQSCCGTRACPTMCWVSPWRTTAKEQDTADCTDSTDSEGERLTSQWDPRPKSVWAERPRWDQEEWTSSSDSDLDIYMGEEELSLQDLLRAEQEYEGDWEEEEEEEQQEEQQEVRGQYLRALRGVFPLLQKAHTHSVSWGSEAELEYLRDDVAIGNTGPTPSPEPRDEPPSCFSCSDTSQGDASYLASDHSSDDLSSGVFSSSNSHTDGLLEWMESTNQASSRCLEGIDIWIEKPRGECLRIRERRRVKIGHVAIGISDQVSGKVFTLETLDRKPVSFEEEIKQSGLWLRCVPAPDQCQRWTWRVRDGTLELRE